MMLIRSVLLTMLFFPSAMPAIGQSKKAFGFGIEVNNFRYRERYTITGVGGGFLLQMERKVSDRFSIVPTVGLVYPEFFLGVAGRIYLSNIVYVQPGVNASIGAGGNEGPSFGGGASGSAGTSIPVREKKYLDISLRVETLHLTDRSYLIYGVRVTYNFGL